MNHIRIFRQYLPTYIVILVVLEYAVMVAAVYVAFSLRFSGETPNAIDLDGLWPRAHLYAAINLISMISMGAYRPHNPEGLTGSVLRSMVAIFLIGTAILSVSFYLFPSIEIYLGRGVLAIASVIGLFAIALLRWVMRTIVGNETLRWQVLVVGAGDRAERVITALAAMKAQADIKLVGCWPVSTAEPKMSSELLLKPEGPLLPFCHRHKVQEIVVAVDERRRSGGNSFPLEELLDCKLDGIEVTDDLSFLERESGQLDIRALSPGWLVFSDGFSFSLLRDSLERGFDVMASMLLLSVTWPFMLLTIVAIKLEEGVRAPIIYSQERVGFGGKIFRVHKFRSMRIDAEKDGKARWAQKNDSRITWVGQFIRNTRIDELPQIFNVLKGEMSFVGPRPERPQFVGELATQIPYYTERHRTKPGITGWAQLCYPYGASVQDAEEKLKYDLYYIKNHSLIFDLYILVRTVEVILLGKGAH